MERQSIEYRIDGWNSYQFLMPQEIFREKQIASHNGTVILPAYNKEVCVESIVLLAKRYTDKVITIISSSSDKTAGVTTNTGLSIVHTMNKGKRRYFKTGFEAAEGA